MNSARPLQVQIFLSALFFACFRRKRRISRTAVYPKTPARTLQLNVVPLDHGKVHGMCCKRCRLGLIGFGVHATKAATVFKGRHFDAEIIALCVRWYLRFSLSFRDLEEIMAERHLSVDHVTIWRCDETYVRVAGKWTYLYRAVDSTGATIDFLVSARRDAAAAKRFFQKALRSPTHPRPRVINVDGNPSYPKVIAELKQIGKFGKRCRCRPIRYLNNIVEQDHRAVKEG